MKQRLLVAAIGVPLLIVVLVILPPVAAWILTAAIAAAAAWELLHTAGKHVTPLVYALTMLMAVLTVAYISMDGWWTAVTGCISRAHMCSSQRCFSSQS